MPIFEYRCDQCGCDFEHLHLAQSEDTPICPTCCGPNVKKLISAGCVRPNGVPAGAGGFNSAPKCQPSGG
ncbi:MAG: zinc ribbon domain-containing protein [Desulfatitalea sp.]|nr:zinc ribbon domain-containing protein [Desulfatitalea sp.]NNK00429.1 zinc ribbon domain-containing protein [Desulfatitalea sp.]